MTARGLLAEQDYRKMTGIMVYYVGINGIVATSIVTTNLLFHMNPNGDNSLYSPIQTSNGQNFSGTGTTAGFFRILNRGGNWNSFYVNWQNGWQVVGQPTWVITNVSRDTNDLDTILVTISNGTFQSGEFYAFSGIDYTNDISGNNNNGVLGGTDGNNEPLPLLVNNSINAYQFTKSGDYTNGNRITLGSNFLGNDMTVQAWINTTDIGSGYQHYNLMYIMSAEMGGLANDWGFGIDNSGFLAFGDGSNPGSDITINSNSVVNTGTWINAAFTRSKTTGEINLYVNGILRSTTVGNAGATLQSQNQIWIGSGQDGPGYTFGGLIGEILAYDSVLTNSQILQNVNASATTYGYTRSSTTFTLHQSDFTGNASYYNNGTVTYPILQGANGFDGFVVDLSHIPPDQSYFLQAQACPYIVPIGNQDIVNFFNNLVNSGFLNYTYQTTLWSVSWGPGSSIAHGYVIMSGPQNIGGQILMAPVDTTQSGWNTSNGNNPTILAGTYLFPATFTIVTPLVSKGGWC